MLSGKIIFTQKPRIFKRSTLIHGHPVVDLHDQQNLDDHAKKYEFAMTHRYKYDDDDDDDGDSDEDDDVNDDDDDDDDDSNNTNHLDNDKINNKL